MDKQRILFVIPSLKAGGAERVVSLLAGALADKGHKVDILTFSESKDSFYELQKTVTHKNLSTAWEPFGMLHRLRITIRLHFRMRSYFKKSNPSVILSFLTETNIRVILASFCLGIPILTSERIHPSYHPLGRIWKLLRGLTYPLSNTLVVQNQEIANIFTTMIKSPVRIIPNPLFPLTYSGDCNGRTHSKEKEILAVGRLDKQKGFDVLIKAFAEAAPRINGWSLTIYGEGDEREQLESLIKQLGLTDKIQMPGIIDDISKAYARADIFVLSSLYEGFPNVLCEAMAHGVAAISTSCPGGPADIVMDGENGVLVPVNDIDTLAKEIVKLANDDNLRSKLGIEAQKIQRKLSIDKISSLWEETIERVTTGQDRSKS